MAGKLTVVGLGDGSLANLTLAAHAALKKATAIVGYRSYINLVKKMGFQSQFYAFGMRQEQERALKALSLASKGEQVVLVCSGDAGVYGLAGLALELAYQKKADVEITVLPGVTAALVVAAQLGAPLVNDFAVISLSDLLTPWEKIKKRIEAAAAADFVLVFYNPMSSLRRWQFREAVNIIKQYRNSETPVGIGKKTTNGEQINIVTLAEAEKLELNMHSLVIVGGSNTKKLGDWLVTERGYRLALASMEK